MLRSVDHVDDGAGGMCGVDEAPSLVRVGNIGDGDCRSRELRWYPFVGQANDLGTRGGEQLGLPLRAFRGAEHHGLAPPHVVEQRQERESADATTIAHAALLTSRPAASQ